MNLSRFHLLWLLLPLWVACSQEEQLSSPAPDGWQACRLYFDGPAPCFEASAQRATAAWPDQACVYLSFDTESKVVDGKAIYDASTDEWTVYYNGVIANNTTSACRAYYFDGPLTLADAQFLLSDSTAVYADTEATYSKSSEGIKLAASLVPPTGRIRFKGEPGRQFQLSGIQHYTAYATNVGQLTGSSAPYTLTIGPSGFTSYIYASFPASSRTLTLAYDNLSFTTQCERPILDAGRSGFMTIPTEANHNGWEMTKVSLAQISTPSASEVGTGSASLSARIVSDGNCRLIDCGFCWSTASQPTVSDAFVSCGPQAADFSANISGLQENTKYYVRAYAVNELGTAYSEVISFTTLPITLPEMSVVTISNILSTTADASAQVTSLGNGRLSDAGFVFATHANPSLADTKVSTGTNSTLKVKLRNLTPLTTYYIRAYATNEKGTGYGAVISFTTNEKPAGSEIETGGFEGEDNNWNP